MHAAVDGRGRGRPHHHRPRCDRRGRRRPEAGRTGRRRHDRRDQGEDGCAAGYERGGLIAVVRPRAGLDYREAGATQVAPVFLLRLAHLP
ncbi:Adenosylhomocysteinase [Paraburkholderia caribensis]|nr:Adenosylhomocysteinase [Paraburkholderia caribensis]